MEEFKGTKGEWIYSSATLVNNQHHRPQLGFRVIGGGELVEKLIVNVYGASEENEANTQLIASAPILLKEVIDDEKLISDFLKKSFTAETARYFLENLKSGKAFKINKALGKS